MWRSQASIPLLDTYRQANGVAHGVTAPGRADATLHRSHGLTVRMSAFEASIDQFLPDLWKLMSRSAEHVDALPARDFCVKAVFLRDLAQRDQFVRCDLAAWNPWDD